MGKTTKKTQKTWSAEIFHSRKTKEGKFYNREEKDKRPDPIRFTQVRASGSILDPVSWSLLSLFQQYFSNSVV